MNNYETWQGALDEEIGFWRQIINGTFPEKSWCEDMRVRARGENGLPNPILSFVHPGARILDVGAGPVSVLGLRNAPAEVELVAVDPLAEAYAALLAEAAVTPWNVTRWSEAERLSEMKLGLFDVVYSRNALDHSYDPTRAIIEMTKVCKPTGLVFLEGSVNESVKQNAAGLHQWNFMPIDSGELVIWQPNGAAVSLRQALGADYHVSAGYPGPNRFDWLHVKITRSHSGTQSKPPARFGFLRGNS